MRAQVVKVRGLAHQIIGMPQFSLESGIACGMLIAAAEQLERVCVDSAQSEARHLEKIQRLQKLVDAQSREIELHQSHASTVPKV